MNILNTFKLDGKVAIITGASRGLGKAMAETLAYAGADIIINSRNKTEIKKAGQEIERKTGKKVLAIKADVSKSNEVKKIIKESLRKFNKIDILINNAGIMIRKPTNKYTDNEIDAVIDTNLKGVIYLCREVSKIMSKNRWGRIINIGSLHSFVSIPERAVYAATKGALVTLTKSLALEYAKYGITVNLICPGVFETEINIDWMKNPPKRKKMLEKIPLGYFGKPEDLAGTVLFLASEASSYITGTSIVIDGGYTAQ